MEEKPPKRKAESSISPIPPANVSQTRLFDG